ncbi:hypothetical protein M3Y99_00034500 [Aphelenchoides fujianensis]|nr:hypothetical protein M3Y99_00034500 [Aphelenchoides fujianensis]
MSSLSTSSDSHGITACSCACFCLIIPKMSSKRLALLMLVTLAVVSQMCATHKQVCWILTSASAMTPVFYWLALETNRRTLSTVLYWSYSKTSESAQVE